MVQKTNDEPNQMSPEMARVIQQRLVHAHKQHPEGATLQALIDEVVEVEHEYLADYERYIYELYDVIAVAVRLIRQAQAEDKI